MNLVFCLLGPTAAGKTEITINLVRQFPFEVISVDSALIYRDMNIGTAKPAPEILAEVPHHLIDIINPNETYSAADFCDHTIKLCKEIFARGKIPLLSGGTMMYFNSLQQGLSRLPAKNEVVRQQLLKEAEIHGWQYMHERLKKVDAKAAARIHPNDSQRLQRALEIVTISGSPVSTFPKLDSNNDYQYVNLLLMPNDRNWLHARIKQRFLQMLELGLVEEVQHLAQNWNLSLSNPSMRSVGYRQILQFLQGEFDYNSMCEKGIAATRQLAKRQLTWLRHWPNGETFLPEEQECYDKIYAKILKKLDGVSIV